MATKNTILMPGTRTGTKGKWVLVSCIGWNFRPLTEGSYEYCKERCKSMGESVWTRKHFVEDIYGYRYFGT